MTNEEAPKGTEKKTEVKVVGSTPIKDFDPYKIIKFPLSTEKSIRQIEFDNKLTFVVDGKATKPQIKKAIEELFKVKVLGVNTQNSFKGHKRAYIKLSPESLASDVSADLGLI
jgi:ribosomal protein uL23